MISVDYAWGAYYVICSTLSSFGNLATIAILSQRKALRTVSNCLIGHLAVVDFLTGCPIVLSNALRLLSLYVSQLPLLLVNIFSWQ